MSYEDDKKMHHAMDFLGLRAQATAAGLLQLCLELRHANLLEEDAIERIKDAIAGQIAMSRPRSIAKTDYERNIRRRLDALFAGHEPIGDTEALEADLKS